MIDVPEKANRLVAELKASLPVEARPTQALMEIIAKQAPDLAASDSCNVVGIFYMGDEGGIACGLDFDGSASKTPYVVSITHLTFDRRTPLFRHIDAYRRHRIKKLKQQSRRNY